VLAVELIKRENRLKDWEMMVEFPLIRARELKCRNAEHPDGYGHYREARYTQTKHHWWWKANFVFNSILALQNYSGKRRKTY